MSGTPAKWVQFPEFRRYESTRQDANNAMMALMAGSELARHTLKLTTGSQHLLPDIFPGVDHIRYFNLRTDNATELLQDTGHHLGAVAIPYALAVHEDFVMTVIELLRGLNYKMRVPDDKALKAWNMHETLHLTLSGPAAQLSDPPVTLEYFHLLRVMRNAQIHAGGYVDGRLRGRVSGMSQAAIEGWLEVSHRSPNEVIADDTIKYTIFDIFAVFATIKSLGRWINELLNAGVSRSQWANICRLDYLTVTSKPSGTDRWMRGLFGHANQHYGATGVSEGDLLASAIAADQWKAERSLTPKRRSRGANSPRNPGTQKPK